MTLAKVFEQAIKEHCKDRKYLNGYKGIKVIKVEFEEMREMSGRKEGVQCISYIAYCKVNAKKYDNNRLAFEVVTYSDGSQIDVYFDDEYYENN